MNFFMFLYFLVIIGVCVAIPVGLLYALFHLIKWLYTSGYLSWTREHLLVIGADEESKRVYQFKGKYCGSRPTSDYPDCSVWVNHLDVYRTEDHVIIHAVAPFSSKEEEWTKKILISDLLDKDSRYYWKNEYRYKMIALKARVITVEDTWEKVT